MVSDPTINKASATVSAERALTRVVCIGINTEDKRRRPEEQKSKMSKKDRVIIIRGKEERADSDSSRGKEKLNINDL